MQETQGRLEQAQLRLRDLREEADQVRRDCHEMLRREGSPDSRRDELDQLRLRLEASLNQEHVLTAKVCQLPALISFSADYAHIWVLSGITSMCGPVEVGARTAQQVQAECELTHVQVEQLERERSEQEQTLARLKQELDDKSGLELQLARYVIRAT